MTVTEMSRYATGQCTPTVTLLLTHQFRVVITDNQRWWFQVPALVFRDMSMLGV